MRGDADAVRRLVLNLAGNARKHTDAGTIHVAVRGFREGGEVSTELTVPSTETGEPGSSLGTQHSVLSTPRTGREWVEITVRDTGRGIPPDIAARLGEAFALNAGVVGANHVQGTGLGLSICKAIVAAHGGTMRIESAPGAGTTVTARLRADLDGPAANPVAAGIEVVPAARRAADEPPSELGVGITGAAEAGGGGAGAGGCP
jgi:signal transduction histidine kinase